MKKLFLLLLLALLIEHGGWRSADAVQIYTETFYLCVGGDGTAPEDGTCTHAFSAAGFNTVGNWDVDDADDGKIGPNDRVVVLDDGGPIRAQLVFQQPGLSGKPITLTGEAGAVVTTALNKNSTGNWSDGGGNIWSTTGFSGDVGNLYSAGISVGTKVSSAGALNAQGKFFYNAGTLQVYSVGNPATFYSGDLECAFDPSLGSTGVIQTRKAYTTITAITVKYGGGHGIWITSASHVVVSNNAISNIGGSYISGTTRYGNGVELWEAGQDISITGNAVSQCFDEGLSLQGTAASAVVDATLSGNTVDKSGRGGSFTNANVGASFTNLLIAGNQFTDLGLGWATQAQGTNGQGLGMLLSIGGTCTNCVVQNNLIRNTLSGSDPIGQGISAFNGVWNLYRNWIENTHNSGIRIHGASGGTVAYNVVWQLNGKSGLYLTSVSNPINIYNNVFVKTEAGNTHMVTLGTQDFFATNWVFKNNIVADISGSDSSFGYYTLFVPSAGDSGTLSNNLYYNAHGSGTVNGWQGVAKSSKAAWDAASGEANDIWSNPSFASSSNFRIQATSPTINAGVNVGLTSDITGLPIVGAPDIGAYEFLPPTSNIAQFPASGSDGLFAAHGGGDPLGVAGLSNGLVAYWGFNGATKTIGSTPDFYNYENISGLHFRLVSALQITSGSSAPINKDWVESGPTVGQQGGGIVRPTTVFRFAQSGFTVSVWTKPTSGGDFPVFERQIIQAECSVFVDPTCGGGVTEPNWTMRAQDSSLGIVARVYDSVSGSSAVFLTPSVAWNHWVMVYDPATKIVTFYKNAVPTASAPLTNGLKNNSNSLTLIEDTNEYDWFIDEIVVWRLPLSAAQVTTLNNVGAGRFF